MPQIRIRRLKPPSRQAPDTRTRWVTLAALTTVCCSSGALTCGHPQGAVEPGAVVGVATGPRGAFTDRLDEQVAQPRVRVRDAGLGDPLDGVTDDGGRNLPANGCWLGWTGGRGAGSRSRAARPWRRCRTPRPGPTVSRAVSGPPPSAFAGRLRPPSSVTPSRGSPRPAYRTRTRCCASCSSRRSVHAPRGPVATPTAAPGSTAPCG
jgi:hypothetical protein